MSASSSKPLPASGCRLDEEDEGFRTGEGRDALTAGLGFEGAGDVLRCWRRGMRPDPDLAVSEWTDQHRWLSLRASAAGPSSPVYR